MNKHFVFGVSSIGIICVILTGLLFGFNAIGDYISHSYPTQIEILEFNDFVIAESSDYVNSIKTDSNITFQISQNTSLDSKQTESYLFDLDSYGYCLDFNMSIQVDYNYTGSMMNDFYLKLGSYYDEAGNYIDEIIDGPKTVCYCGVVDAWAGTGGRYTVGARPNGTLDKYTTDYGSISSNATLKYLISRKQGVANCTIVKNSLTELTHIWSANLERPISFILLQSHGNPYYVLETEGTYSAINGTFIICGDLPVTITETITDTTTITIGIFLLSLGTIVFGTMVLIIVYRKLKMNY